MSLKTIPINKIKFIGKNHDLVDQRIFEIYGKRYTVLIHNGTFYIATNAGNIQTALETKLNLELQNNREVKT